MSIGILSHLGHSIDYNVVCEIETAEAELAMRNLSLNKEPLEETFLTFWWADNFNQNTETLTGQGTINSTYIVEFPEPNFRALPSAGLTTIPRSKRRSLQAAPERIPDVRIDKKMEPVLVSSNTDNQTVQQSKCEVERFCVKSAEEGTILEETKLTYLPPINALITDFSTICKIFEVIQKRAARVKMQYENMTFDIGAAINAHKVLWNYPERFKNIIIHLGDFHFMKEMFAVLEKLVCGSGFEDAVSRQAFAQMEA